MELPGWGWGWGCLSRLQAAAQRQPYPGVCKQRGRPCRGQLGPQPARGRGARGSVCARGQRQVGACGRQWGQKKCGLGACLGWRTEARWGVQRGVLFLVPAWLYDGYLCIVLCLLLWPRIGLVWCRSEEAQGRSLLWWRGGCWAPAVKRQLASVPAVNCTSGGRLWGWGRGPAWARGLYCSWSSCGLWRLRRNKGRLCVLRAGQRWRLGGGSAGSVVSVCCCGACCLGLLVMVGPAAATGGGGGRGARPALAPRPARRCVCVC